MTQDLPVVVIGAGPIGLAAASHLVVRNVPVLVLEAGPSVAINIRDWGHVRLFSIWSQCIDEAARTLLSRAGWRGVSANQLPTGSDLVRDYLEPLAATPELSRVIETKARVIKVVRRGLDRMSSKEREERPFEITVEDQNGYRRQIMARAVIDTSGTWQNPNPVGADGWAAEGESEASRFIRYGIPDVSGTERALYAGKRTVVVGGGHSAANALLDLALLAEKEPGTTITWAVRGRSLATVFGGGETDQLPARGALGQRLKGLTEAGCLTMVMSLPVEKIVPTSGGAILSGMSYGKILDIGPFERIIVATGQRPDFSFARELRLDLDPAVESTRLLGPMIDPNLHSCGTVPPHGWRELAHPETGYFVAGIKSYGRAPTFLLLTGYEQVRSIVARLAGDDRAADDVRLVLPETGVCNATLEQVAPGGLCCSEPEAEPATSCCSPKTIPVPDQRAAACCG